MNITSLSVYTVREQIVKIFFRLFEDQISLYNIIYYIIYYA